jgi:hypothetical protein
MPKQSKKLRKNIMIRPELDLQIKETAGKYGTSESAVIEKALEKFLGEEDGEELPAFFEYAGAFDCRHTDLATTYKSTKSTRKR